MWTTLNMNDRMALYAYTVRERLVTEDAVGLGTYKAMAMLKAMLPHCDTARLIATNCPGARAALFCAG